MQSCGMAQQHFYYLFEDICDAVHWMFGQAAVALLREHEGVTLWQEGLPAAQKAKLQKKLFAGTDEKSPNPWLFTGVYEGGPQARKGQPAEDILFEMQRQGILELARKESCIIVGRCADVAPRSAGIPAVSLFICAPLEDQVRRRMEIEGIGPKEAEDAVRKIDERREKYCDTYTGRNRGTPENYDFCINSSAQGIRGTAEQVVCVRGAW